MAIVPPSVASLKQRLVARGTENEKTLATRLGNAPSELIQIFGMKETFCYRVINEDLSLSEKVFNTLVDSLY